MENNINKAAILIAESVVIVVEALGMKSYNDDRIQNGLSAGYDDYTFRYMAEDLSKKIEKFKNETSVK